jgi:hypothetical protein
VRAAAGEALGLRWAYLVGRCRECDYPARLDACWSEPGVTRCPRCGGQCRAEARVWYQLQRLPWRHGCDDPVACTKDRHRWPCPKHCPKARRPSGRRHRCIPADDPHLCPKDCQRHAKACPNRQGGGLVLRPIKGRRKKTVPLAPEGRGQPDGQGPVRNCNQNCTQERGARAVRVSDAGPPA